MRDDITYRVLWHAHLDVPAGWRTEGPTGTRDECSAYVDETWTDMRPKTLRGHMDAH